MMPLSLTQKLGGAPSQILCLGAHSDDIEIGCGGTLLKLINLYPDYIFIGWYLVLVEIERRKPQIVL